MKSEHNIPEWNKDRVWKNVEDKLHQKKKRRLLYWWSFGATSMFLLIGLLIWNNTDAPSTSMNKNAVVKSKQIDAPLETQAHSQLNKIMELDSDIVQESATSKAYIKEDNKDDFSLSKNNVRSTEVLIQSKEVVESVSYVVKKRNTDIVDGRQNKVAVPQSISIENEEIKLADHKRNGFQLPLAMLTNDLSTLKRNKRDTTISHQFNIVPFQNINKESAALLLWAESGLSFGDRSFVNIPDREFSRNTLEQFRFIHTNALGVQKFLSTNWSLKLGLAYQTIYEKYEYVQSFVNEEEIISDIGIVYNLPSGVTHYEAGVGTLKSTSTRHIIRNNLIHRLNVPVEVAYSLLKANWSLEPSFGFRMQFFQQFNGVVSGVEGSFMDLQEINDAFYSQNVRLGIITSLNLKYNIFQNASLGFKISYERDDFLNLIKNDFYSKYETFGFQLGYYHSL